MSKFLILSGLLVVLADGSGQANLADRIANPANESRSLSAAPATQAKGSAATGDATRCQAELDRMFAGLPKDDQYYRDHTGRRSADGRALLIEFDHSNYIMAGVLQRYPPPSTYGANKAEHYAPLLFNDRAALNDLLRGFEKARTETTGQSQGWYARYDWGICIIKRRLAEMK